MTTPLDLAELDRPALEAALAERGQERFRARQIFQWIFRRGVTNADLMTDLSRELRATLTTQFKEFNLDCVGCHVTGYGRPGGSTVTHVEKLKDVQCEACHA